MERILRGLIADDEENARKILNKLLEETLYFNAFDVIPIGKVLILIGNDGLYQYNYSNVKNITLLSSILVMK